MKDLNKKVKVGEVVKLTLEIEIEVQEISGAVIEANFSDVLEPSLAFSSFNDITIFNQCIKKIKKL